MSAFHEVHEVVDPVSIGLDPPRLRALVDRARREVTDGLLPSCQVAVARDGRLGLFETIGEATSASRYVIFSATKALVASAVWLLVQDGGLDVACRVADVMPPFAANGKDTVTVEQVLLHESGFPHAPLDMTAWGDREARLMAFAEWTLVSAPGSRYEYHPTSAHWVLAEIVERLAGEDYRTFIRRRVLEPHGLDELALGVPPVQQGDVARPVVVGRDVTPDELEALLGIRELPLVGVTPEALAEVGTPAGLAPGNPGGGAVSTAADLALFYQALLHNQAGIWTDETLHGLTAEVRSRRPDVAGIPVNRTLGLVVAGDDGMAPLRGCGTTVGPRTFGHSGAGGQLAWADPDSGISFSFLTNGIDRHYLQEWGRSSELNTLAGQCGRNR